MKRNSGFPGWKHAVGSAIIGCLFLSLAWAADPPSGYQPSSPYSQEIARVGAIQGDAKIQRAGEAQYKKIEVKSPLFLMDYLQTARAAKIWWQGSTRSDVWVPYPEVMHGSLGENTIFGFAGFQRVGRSTIFVGHVPKGIVRFIKKLPLTDPPSSFSVVTPTAIVEVVPTDRAADFFVETIEASRTTVTVLWGQVKVRNVSEQFKEVRVLTSCQEVDVEKDKEPGEIRWVSTDTMKNLIKRTTIPRTLPEDVPACERIKTEVIGLPGAVFLPPAGVLVVPVPVPTPPEKDQCPCPPGTYQDPASKECKCCPPNRRYNPESCDCACPCPPNYGTAPTGPLGAAGTQCVPCRRGAIYDPATCECLCPCPPGQYLLPGQGCVPQCPEGFYPNFDQSTGVPYQCPICVRQPVPEPPPGCTTNEQCQPCSVCREGRCVDPQPCPEGQVRYYPDCRCQFPDSPALSCDDNRPCPNCQECREGICRSVLVCGPGLRLNLQTCQCERADVPPIPPAPEVPELLSTTPSPPECQANSECPSGEVCRKGKCVKKPPRKPQPIEEEETTDEPTTSSGTFTPIFPRRGFDIGIGIGGGGMGRTPRGSSGPPRQLRPPSRPN